MPRVRRHGGRVSWRGRRNRPHRGNRAQPRLSTTRRDSTPKLRKPLSVTRTFIFFKSSWFMALRPISRSTANLLPNPALTQWRQMEGLPHAGSHTSQASGLCAIGIGNQHESRLYTFIRVLLFWAGSTEPRNRRRRYRSGAQVEGFTIHSMCAHARVGRRGAPEMFRTSSPRHRDTSTLR
jgi:hypothetical protein